MGALERLCPSAFTLSPSKAWAERRILDSSASSKKARESKCKRWLCLLVKTLIKIYRVFPKSQVTFAGANLELPLGTFGKTPAILMAAASAGREGTDPFCVSDWECGRKVGASEGIRKLRIRFQLLQKCLCNLPYANSLQESFKNGNAERRDKKWVKAVMNCHEKLARTTSSHGLMLFGMFMTE